MRVQLDRHQTRTGIAFGAWLLVAGGAFFADRLAPTFLILPSGRSLFDLIGLLASLLALVEFLILVTHWFLARRSKPPVEGVMVGRVYRLGAVLAVVLTIAYGMGSLSSFGAFFSLFGGMLLGWSLQAPVNGFAAWILVSLKRPFRPGDRIQFPNLGLTGDVKETGPMYTFLNQVGGTIGSEEAVGRYILVPNAMLFSQVVINYTMVQESPYMLDEVIVRITYDSDWGRAERILVNAATAVTPDIIEATGVQPYIRSDTYDYGVYLRLRYQTRVKDRAEISYRITRMIFEAVQRERTVDIAIPYVYSYRTGADRKEDEVVTRRGQDAPTEDTALSVRTQEAREIEVALIHSTLQPGDTEEIERAARSMSPEWLRQPIVVSSSPEEDRYQIVAGHLQFEVCRMLGWETLAAVVVEPRGDGASATVPVLGRPVRRKESSVLGEATSHHPSLQDAEELIEA